MIINKIQESCTHIFLKTFNSEFWDIEVWLVDQNSQPLQMEDIMNLTLVIKTSTKCDSII